MASVYGDYGQTTTYFYRTPTNKSPGVQTPPTSLDVRPLQPTTAKVTKALTSTPPTIISRSPQSQSGTPSFGRLLTPRSSLDSPIEGFFRQIVDHRNASSPGYERLVLDVPANQYEQLQRRLEEHPGRLRYNYDFVKEKLVSFPNPSPVHESIGTFFYDMMASIGTKLNEINSETSVDSMGSQSTPIHTGGRKLHDKGADLSFRVATPDSPLNYPAFVIEIGYSETEHDLLADAADWLCRTEGYVLAVLIVKIEKPDEAHFGDITKWKGWMQVYVQSRMQPQKIIKSGPRIDFIPPSDNIKPLEIPMDYILTPRQMEQLQLTDDEKNFSFTFDPKTIIKPFDRSIKVMAFRKTGALQEVLPPKRKLMREDEESALEIEPTGVRQKKAKKV